MDERWDAIETCERLFRGTPLRVTTAEIGLARLPEGCELIRIGAPLRPEFAAWRYGNHFIKRRNRSRLIAGGAALVAGAGAVAYAPAILSAVSIGALSIIVLPGVTTVLGTVPVAGALAFRDYLQTDRVIGRITSGHRPITVRAKHAMDAELRVRGGDSSVTLDLPHDDGWAHFEGMEAMHAAGALLASANRFGAPPAQVDEAVNRIEEFGDAATYLRAASSLGNARGSRLVSLLAIWRRLGAMHLSDTECLALEMALHEEGERRALEGELAMLVTAWREAEEIAHLADAI
jgi:hypothetical protein